MQENEIAVSVIVIAENAQKTLPRCLRALRNQSLRDCAGMETIVLDCGSNDRTFELALEFAGEDPDFFRVQRRSSAGRAGEIGLALAHGKYIAFCDLTARKGPDLPPDMYRALYESCEAGKLSYTGLEGAKIWDPALRGMLLHKDFLAAHSLPVKSGYNLAEQLAAYDTLRQQLGAGSMGLFCTDWILTLRGICREEYRESQKSSAAFYRRIIALADTPQVIEALSLADRSGLNRAAKKFYDAFSARDWIKAEIIMKNLCKRDAWCASQP